MKRIIGLSLVVVMLLTVLFAFSSCKNEKAKVEVYKEYELTSEEYAFAVAKENAELIDKANELISDLKKSGELNEIITSFFDGKAKFVYENPVSSVPTGAEREKYLVVATNAYFPPFEYYQGDKLTGVDMKIASLLAEKLGKTLYISDMDFNAIVESVKMGAADIGMAGMTVNAVRLESVNFTESYYESAQVLVVRQDDKSFADCKSAEDIVAKFKKEDKNFKIGTQTATTGHMFVAGNEDFGYEGFSNLTCRDYQTGALAILDLANYRVDAVVLDKQPALMIAESSNSMTVWDVFYSQLVEYEGYKTILTGLKNTAIISVLGLLIGMVLGCLLATAKIIPKSSVLRKILSGASDVYIAIFRGTPMVVQLLLIHFVLFPLIGIEMPVLLEAVLAFGLNSGAYVSEIMRGGILSVDLGQTEAGRALGLNYRQTMMRIVLPQAVKNVVPTLGNEFIALLKETSVVSFITVVDLTKAFQNIANSTYEYIVPYIALALIYLVLVLAVTGIVKLVERRMRASDRR